MHLKWHQHFFKPPFMNVQEELSKTVILQYFVMLKVAVTEPRISHTEMGKNDVFSQVCVKVECN